MDDVDNDAFEDIMNILESEVGCDVDEDGDLAPLDFNEI